MSSKAASWVWKHFKTVSDTHAKCQLCGDVLKSSDGTTGMGHHLKGKKHNPKPKATGCSDGGAMLKYARVHNVAQVQFSYILLVYFDYMHMFVFRRLSRMQSSVGCASTCALLVLSSLWASKCSWQNAYRI
jgi:hypothetical protein